MMARVRKYLLAVVVGAVLVSMAGNGWKATAQTRRPAPGEVLAVVTPIYEGWYKNRDGGGYIFSYGYLNRHTEPITIPLGPNNAFAPAPADRGQPTVFLPGRQRHVVRLSVPETQKAAIVWRLIHNGMTATSTPNGGTNPLYLITDLPPRVSAGADQTVLAPAAVKLAATVNTDDIPSDIQVTYEWRKQTGPGDVTFTPPNALQTSASFSAPGTYVLRFVATRPSGMDTINGTDDVRVVVRPGP